MDPKITSQIWSNQCFDEADVDGKLAALWLITNEQVDLLGYCNLNKRRFVFETRLTIEALAKGFAALGEGCVQLAKGYWLRNFIAVQFGRGPSLSKNNFAKALCRMLNSGTEADLGVAVLNEYPELLNVQGFISPWKGVSKGSRASRSTGEEKRREEKRREDQGGTGETANSSAVNNAADVSTGAPSSPTAEDIYAAYPRKVARATALKAIESAMASYPADELLIAVIKYATAVAGWSLQERAFVPYPATWFRAEQFLDDPTVWSRAAAEGKNHDVGSAPTTSSSCLILPASAYPDVPHPADFKP